MDDTVGQELAVIRGTLERDPDTYYRDEGMQARYRELIEARDSGAAVPAVNRHERELADLRLKMADQHSDYWQGPTAEQNQARYRQLLGGDSSPLEDWRSTSDRARANLPASVVYAWDAAGDFDGSLRRAQDSAAFAMASAKEGQFEGFDGLPQGAQAAVYREIGRPALSAVDVATPDEIEAFASISGAQECVNAWGDQAPRKVAIVLERYARAVGDMGAKDRSDFKWWFFSALSPQERCSAFWTLGGR